MMSHIVRAAVRYGVPHRYFLCSDLHIGSPNCDSSRIRREFDAAVAWGCKILINGDVFDAIACGDKRYKPGAAVPEMETRRDPLMAMLDLGEKILGPYADSIEMIGIGNHETAWERRTNSEPVSHLLKRLNPLKTNGKIRKGGYSGFWVTKLDVVSRRGRVEKSFDHTLQYHHGAGGDSPVTKGTIDMNRAAVRFRYDAHTFGHKHNKIAVEDVEVRVNTQTGRIHHHPRYSIQTGSYFRNLMQGDENNALGHSYAEEGNHGAKPFGGWVLALTVLRERTENRDYYVQQDIHSPLLPVVGASVA